MTIIAAAYDDPTTYAIAADSYSQANGLRIPDNEKVKRCGAILVGGAGSGHETTVGLDWLATEGLSLAQTDLRAALAAMRRHILATTERVGTCVGLDSHYLAVGPKGCMVLGSNGQVGVLPNRWAVGCGEDVGIGAMYRRAGSPEYVVRLAVEAACAVREGCFGEAVVLVGSPAPAVSLSPGVSDYVNTVWTQMS